jgi:hypothetical protein
MFKRGIIMAVVTVAFLMSSGARVAKADSFTLYCTGGNTCFSSNAGLGSYWTLKSNITLNTSLSTFDYKLDVSATGESNPGYLNDFAAQLFFGPGAGVSNLAMPENPGAWSQLAASKAGNNGTCNGSANGAFCASDNVATQGTPVALGTAPVEFEITGNYTGTYLSGGLWNFQAAASANSNDSGGHVFAISLPVAEPSTLLLLGTGLIGLAAILRRARTVQA